MFQGALGKVRFIDSTDSYWICRQSPSAVAPGIRGESFPMSNSKRYLWFGFVATGGPNAKQMDRICFLFPEALRRVLLLKAAANFTRQLLMPTCRELLHLPTSHANLSRVTSPANFSCQLVESYFTCLLLMSTF